MSEPWQDAYTAWTGSDDYRLRLSVQHGFEAGWRARDEEVAALLARAESAERALTRHQDGHTFMLVEDWDYAAYGRMQDRSKEAEARAEAAEARLRSLEPVVRRMAELRQTIITREFGSFDKLLDSLIQHATQALAADPPMPPDPLAFRAALGVIIPTADLRPPEEIIRELHGDPPTPTGEASGKMEARLKQAEEAERDFYRRQGKL